MNWVNLRLESICEDLAAGFGLHLDDVVQEKLFAAGELLVFEELTQLVALM